MAKFKFKETATGYDVFAGSKNLGGIVPMKESTGRHCFRLAEDDPKSPRTYRGKQKAAEALMTIAKIAETAKKKKLSVEQVIIQAWSDRPAASPRS
ncbi:MAG: hypothetical protein R3E01_24915 [Pirellulaceae bacterium]